MNKLINSPVFARCLYGLPILILLFTSTSSTKDLTQDVNFRLINIERRLDQLQQRVDFVERAIQNQNITSANRSNDSTASVLELQRQQLTLAEQVITIQKRMLDHQKAIDQLREGGQEKKDKPKEGTKPKQ